jgi:hypothetical protein
LKNPKSNPGSASKVPRTNMRISSDDKNVSTKLPNSKIPSTGFSASKYISKNLEDVIKAHSFTGFVPTVEEDLLELETFSSKSIMEDDDSDFQNQLDMVADLYEAEFGIDYEAPIVFGEAPEMFSEYLDVEFGVKSTTSAERLSICQEFDSQDK